MINTPQLHWTVEDGHVVSTDGNGLVVLTVPEAVVQVTEAEALLGSSAAANAALCSDRERLLQRLVPLLNVGLPPSSDYALRAVGGELVASIGVDLESHRALVPLATLRELNITTSQAWLAAGHTTLNWLIGGPFTLSSARDKQVVTVIDETGRSAWVAAFPQLLTLLATRAGLRRSPLMWAIPRVELLVFAPDTPALYSAFEQFVYHAWIRAGESALSPDVLSYLDGVPTAKNVKH